MTGKQAQQHHLLNTHLAFKAGGEFKELLFLQLQENLQSTQTEVLKLQWKNDKLIIIYIIIYIKCARCFSHSLGSPWVTFTSGFFPLPHVNTLKSFSNDLYFLLFITVRCWYFTIPSASLGVGGRKKEEEFREVGLVSLLSQNLFCSW